MHGLQSVPLLQAVVSSSASTQMPLFRCSLAHKTFSPFWKKISFRLFLIICRIQITMLQESAGATPAFNY